MQFLDTVNLGDEKARLPTVLKQAKPSQSPYVAESCHKDLVPHLVTVLFATVFLVPHVVGTQEIRVEWMNKWMPERPSWGLIENKMGPN